MGVTLSAGGSLRWWRDAMCEDLVASARTQGVDPYELILKQAETAPFGCEGALFLPYLSGERTPHADPNARGTFVGMSTRTTRAHLTRAIVEGVTCSLREVLALVRQTGARTDRIRLSGGGARNPFWRQLMTDAFDLPTATVEQTDGAAYGSALIAGVGVGLWPDFDRATAHIKESNSTRVGPNAAYFPALARRYAHAYSALAPWFSEQSAEQSAQSRSEQKVLD
jgi:xylulokinase